MNITKKCCWVLLYLWLFLLQGGFSLGGDEMKLEKQMKVLGIIIVISAVVVLSGAGYIWQFSGVLGNDFWLSPGGEIGEGLQFSPNDCDCDYVNDILCRILVLDCA